MKYIINYKKNIFITLFIILFLLSSGLIFADSDKEEIEYPQERVKPGDPIPIFSFTDVFDKTDSNDYPDDWFFLYCFANYKNFDLLLSWVSSAAVETYKYYPKVKWRAIAFPDVIIFPEFINIIGGPVLRTIVRAALKDVKIAYEEDGIEFPSPTSKFYIVPDWSGKYHYTFGLENADKYQVIMGSKGKVFAVFDQDTPNIKKKFIKKFKEWADKMKR